MSGFGMVEMVDADEFDAFYRGTSQRLVRYAYGLAGDTSEAQDLVQEAYTRAWQRWHTVRGYTDPEAWLRTVVTRLTTDRWRRLRVRRDAFRAERPPESAGPPSEDTVLLVRALRMLPVDHRRVLTLHYLLDRSIADIAAETGANVNTVKSWLARGRLGLAAVLAASPAATSASSVGPAGSVAQSGSVAQPSRGGTDEG